jgi:K+-transporting ATPase ATPase C chain
MLAQARTALVALVMLTVLTGVAYPLLVTGIGRVAFAQKAQGSVVMQGGRPVGSSLLGQPFDDPKYFWSRPSATSPFPYNAGSSTASNLGPTNPALIDAVQARIKALREADPDNGAPIPVDLVTASASGLDPHISPAAAYYQAARVARARGGKIDETSVRALIAKHTEGPDLGFLGEPRVNVLELNLDLDAASR